MFAVKEFRISGLNTSLRANRQSMSCLVVEEEDEQDVNEA